MNLKIRTLTPLWTGDIERKSEELRETSIMGSLRWWFEAVIRGFGGYACDPLGEIIDKCEFNVEEYKKGKRPEELVCPVCYIFGTTNWSRRFRLEIDKDSYQPASLELAIDGLSCDYAPPSKNVEWWINQTLGSINPRAVTERDDKGISLNLTVNAPNVMGIIYVILKTIQKLGALGSHNSYGFGVVKTLEPFNTDVDEALTFIEQYCETRKCDEETGLKSSKLPNLKHAFKIDFRLPDEVHNKLHNKNVGFILKYAMRNKFKNMYDKDFAEKLFGSKKDRPDKFAGRIFASNCWEEEGRYFFRIYGMLPPVILGPRKKDEIIKEIEKAVDECLKAEIISKNTFNLDENKHLDIDLFKELVLKNE